MTMTREEAINTLGNLRRYMSGGGAVDLSINKAIDMAISALKDEPLSHEEAWAEIESDLISRTDAIERVELITKCEWDNNVIYRDEVIDALKFAPSAEAVQGDSCDGCKYVGIIEKCEQCRRIYSEMDDLYKGGEDE